MSGQTPRASPRPAPLPPRTPQPPAPRSHLELISQGKQELQVGIPAYGILLDGGAQALSSENDSMLQSCKGVQELIGKLAASRTALKEELDAAHTALEHEEEQRLAADQKVYRRCKLLVIECCELLRDWCWAVAASGSVWEQFGRVAAAGGAADPPGAV
jgi:hypothetical protein